jgi:hypothetical protein
MCVGADTPTNTTTGLNAMNTTTIRPTLPAGMTIDEINAAVRELLTDNTKIRKVPTGDRIINAGISLAPHMRSGIVNVCPEATPGCIAGCVLWFAGRTITKTVRAAAIARTALWHYAPDVFYARLDAALTALERRAARVGADAHCRTNVASDIVHPSWIYANHPNTAFYNYTKLRSEVRRYAAGMLPANYHVSYSLSERSTFADVVEFLRAGVNVVGVFDSVYCGPLHRYGVLPARVVVRHATTGDEYSVDCVDGDIHDIRTPRFDGRGVFVALRGKGSNAAKARAIKTGFFRPFAEGSRYYVREHVREGTAVVVLP